MAEARPEEDDESLRRDAREQVVRRQSSGSEGRAARRKPENRLSQGPLWSLREAIKKSTSRSSFTDLPRDRDRERDRNGEARGPVARRPQITILSAEPLPSPCWLAGTPGAFPPPPPPAAQIWGPTIPPSVQPPPSYDEVIREKTQEQAARASLSGPSGSHPAFRTTIATQTDPGSSSGAPVLKPQRQPIADSKIGSQSPPAPRSGPAPLPDPPDRPRARPRSRSTVNRVSDEVKVQTLVKLREDGLATLAARARSDVGKQDGSGGKYLQELLEAFSSDAWGVPEQRSDDSELSQSDEEDENGDMAALRARIQAFEQQQQQQQVALDESRGDPSTDAVAQRPGPRPRPRLQGQPSKGLPPAIAPKPKSLPKASAADSTDSPAEVLKPKPLLTTEPLPNHPLSAAPVPAPRVPLQKPTHPPTRPRPRPNLRPPPVAPRTSVGAPPPHEKAAASGQVTPTGPPRPCPEVSRGAQAHIQDTVNPAGPSLEANPAPSKAPAPGRAKPPSPVLKKADATTEPPLPPRPSSVKDLPPRPPAVKCVPARPPPPAAASRPRPQTHLGGHRASKRGPPLPPRPKPGHPLFPVHSKQEVLIVLEDPPPEPLPTAVMPLCGTTDCLLDLDVLLPEPGLDSCWQPATQKHAEPPPVSLRRYVALFDFEGADDDELSFSQGDAIDLLEPVDQQWGRGQIHGRVGLFPLSFARLADESPVTVTSSKQSEAGEWVVALFDFPGQTAEDLPFHKGAHIQVIEHVDSQWRRGRLAEREGLYPAAFTQSCQAPPIPRQNAEVRGAARALFAFTAERDDELTVKPGDIITHVESADEHWIVGVVGGKRGVVPKNYILLL
ncbi:LOW QUALITY PROTEIN: SH3 domain-containing protein 19-like [Syngnathoides biaculeatus]|uniref:LOW QUALITY PROTEIN: SH3 domain-containing protein 19-like n=1 Tax=Syngnathoides biaculeatus TaxID=300417 RepID=UPI002ADE8E4A|nr:LOW QUALITY PROTEIN: SH3 domain-containing protein 19-like [Syngnathoides biaculeatus]